MTTLTIVNPVALAKQETAATSEVYAIPPRLREIVGKTIGLFWNGKNGGQYALARTKENLARAYPGVIFRDYLGTMGGVMRRASEEQLDQIARECDAVIGTTAD
jgi:hypothetical protein